ncbi:MAG: tandem-95 repeat protein, partial [Actinomycetia bacterium]|nr:tandem-95 repeat protein [Actinomycetes bacterium]
MAPVVTLLGVNPQPIEIGTPYVELGATALDNYDGDLTSSLVIDQSAVDTSAPGSYLVTYDVTDTSGNSAAQIVRVVAVVDSNGPPVVDPIPNVTVAEGSTASFTPVASDPDGDRLTFTSNGAPPGATVNSATGAFSWATTEDDGGGTFAFTIFVTDDGTPSLSTSVMVTINVAETNTAPSISPIPAQLNNEGEFPSIVTAAVDSDRPYNTLTWSASGFPAGITIDPATGRISGQLSSGTAAASPHSVTVYVSDNGTPQRTSQTTFTWTVLETPNVEPVPANDVYMVALGATLSVGVPGVLSNDTDSNGDPLTVSVVSEPATGTLNLNADGSFTYTAAAGQIDSVLFTYRAGDGRGGFGVATVTIAIVHNEPPTAAPDFVRLETYLPVVIDVLANDSDPEGDRLTVERVIASNITGRIDVNADSTVTYHPRNGFEGREEFSYVAVDSLSNAAIGVVTIDVPPDVTEGATAISGTLGTPNLPFTSPPSDVTIAAVGLQIGQVTLLADAFFQSIEALRVPLAFLLFSVLAVIILGGFTEIPVLIAGRRRRYWSVVRMNRENTLPVRSVPSYDADIIYRYAATATGIISVDKLDGSFLPVDSPRGTGYIDTAYLTTTTDLDHFINDPRPPQLIRQFAAALETGSDLRRFFSPNGLLIAVADKPLLITTNHLIGTLQNTKTSTQTATVALQIDLFEELRQALLDLAQITPSMAHSQSALIPTELWNFPYLAIPAPGHSPWL